MLSFTVEEFEHYVQECLAQFYDFTYLQKHPLVDILLPDAKGPDRIQLFRDLMTEVIAGMRSAPGLGLNSKSERLYNILNLRYVKKHPVQRVLGTLALSERQFYRDHTKAVQTLSGMLWERITGEVRPPLDVSLEEIGSVESEAQRARGEPKQTRSDFHAILQGVLNAIQPLLADRAVTFHVEVADKLAILDSDRTAARQIIMLIVSEVAAHSPEGGSHLSITVPNTPTWCETTFTLHGPLHGEAESVARQIEAHESLQQLVHSIQGEIGVDAKDNEVHVSLRLPLRHEVILVIDDNPNIIRLFRRYVGNLPYQVVGADMYDNAISLARTLQPRCVILDVMLSEQDGWEILQDLKSHPATCSIPVLICSVLDIAELATSLGADAFIKKPPGQDEFVKILQRW